MAASDKSTTGARGGVHTTMPRTGQSSCRASRDRVVSEETWILGGENQTCAAGNYATLDTNSAAPCTSVGLTAVPTSPLVVVRQNNDPRSSGWLTLVVKKFRSLELENTGSVARDHLALERTFLAWLRTSLAFASIGVAITQLFRLNAGSSIGLDSSLRLRQLGKPLGSTFISISIVILLMGFHRYFECQQWIIQGKFPASRGSIILIATITLGLMVASLILILVMGPEEEISI